MNPKKLIVSLLKTVLPLALGIYLFWYFFSSMKSEDKQIFYRAINEANYFWIVLSMLIGVIAYFSRAYRWKYVLEPLGYQTSFWNRYHAVMIGYLVNLTIPRAGEASRSAMLYRSDGVPFSTSFGTIIAERAVDFVVLCSIALVTALIGMDDFMAIKELIEVRFGGQPTAVQTGFQWKYVVYGIMLGGMVLFGLAFIFKASFRSKFVNFVKDVMAGLFSIFRSQYPFSYIFHTAIIWLCYLVMFAISFQALDQTASISSEAMLMGFIAGSLGIMFTNGGIGTYPLLVGIVVAYYMGKDDPEALAIGNALGMLMWTSQTILMILLGLLSVVLLPRNYTKQNANESSDLPVE
jgi:glycosyltransferase 2 family protein